ncbi:50S ribosomal protein L24 [Candidatus Woesearchaeota archaeon]|nr:50S ribosomal protein L24 [Candidatus Woesearchaeota archaeon]
MKKFSIVWKSSKKPRKQRKYRFASPLHIKHKFVNSHLSKELRKKYGKRKIGLRKGDKVKIMKGEFKKHEGKVEAIFLKKTRIFVSGIETTKKDGSKKPLALHPSNLMITELNSDDKLRLEDLGRK